MRGRTGNPGTGGVSGRRATLADDEKVIMVGNATPQRGCAEGAIAIQMSFAAATESAVSTIAS